MKFKNRIAKFGLSHGLRLLEQLFNPIYDEI